ncbi:MAG: L-asparaginase / beta-aspartyl-peptidase [Thermoleophilaceae bacterium]|nr:L-asparaginase / beta-aspartyl-peptidase [Thermoleophilaceae bacterium]
MVHGGCGNPSGGTVENEEDYHRGLEEAVRAAAAALTAGAGALDAAQAAVSRLEDAPMFNAGRGSVLTADATVEMDAAIVCGRTQRAGAVAALTTVRHPVALARAVMEATGDVMLVGAGAERLAAEQGLERMDPGWFVTARQLERLRRAQSGVAHEDPGDTPIGTVGAVVLDDSGALAAATSTGGRRGQRPGRVGDSPIVGAGVFADATVAVSATGNGEAMVRTCGAHEVSALMRLGGLDLVAACERVVGGIEEIGLIAVDSEGNITMPFDTTLMHRGWMVGDGTVETRVFRG